MSYPQAQKVIDQILLNLSQDNRQLSTLKGTFHEECEEVYDSGNRESLEKQLKNRLQMAPAPRRVQHLFSDVF